VTFKPATARKHRDPFTPVTRPCRALTPTTTSTPPIGLLGVSNARLIRAPPTRDRNAVTERPGRAAGGTGTRRVNTNRAASTSRAGSSTCTAQLRSVSLGTTVVHLVVGDADDIGGIPSAAPVAEAEGRSG